MRKPALYIFISYSLFIITSCANQVAPTGGDKDIKPPKVFKYSPENYSTNFKTHDVVITFDEYIQLKDLSTQLVVSPPLKYPLQPKIRKKSLYVHFDDTLQQNATY